MTEEAWTQAWFEAKALRLRQLRKPPDGDADPAEDTADLGDDESPQQ